MPFCIPVVLFFCDRKTALNANDVSKFPCCEELLEKEKQVRRATVMAD